MVSVIACVDDKMGLLFNKRRVSKDIEIINDIKKYTSIININEYSKELFENFEINITNELVSGYNFVETSSLENEESNIDEVIIYYFNRLYPSSLKLKLDINKYELYSKEEFIGKSHKLITKVIYRRIK